MSFFKKKYILITGAHRSGTTWVGQVIATSSGVEYIHEPFNLLNYKKLNSPVKYWFEYVSPKTNTPHQRAFQKYLKKYFHYSMKNFLRDIGKRKKYKGKIRFIKERIRIFISGVKLIKDPIAIMSAEWLVKKYNPIVIILLRHPAAFAASLKSKNWSHDFSHFLKQKNLMEEILGFKKTIEEHCHEDKDIIDQAILLWNIIYYRVKTYQEKYPEWMVVKHEDLSRNPNREFKNIFDTLGLRFTKKVIDKIEHSTKAMEKNEFERNALDNISAWKKILTKGEINRIYEGTLSLASFFYNDEDW